MSGHRGHDVLSPGALEGEKTGAPMPAVQYITGQAAAFANLDDSYFQPLDERKTPEENVAENFDRALEKRLKEFHGRRMNDEDTMTPEEIADYKARVVEDVGLKFWEKVKQEKNETRKQLMWFKVLREAMDDETPAFTEEMEKKIENDPAAGWTPARKKDTPWLRNFTKSDLTTLSGTLDEDEGAPTNTSGDEHDGAQTNRSDGATPREGAALDQAGWWFFSPSPPPAPATILDLRTGAKAEWKKCQGVFGQIRDQGGCGSCWAMAAIGVAESQLCILTGGKFGQVAQMGWLSGGYITSCSTTTNGCKGGIPKNALEWIYKNGVPTGGNGDNWGTCVPYFGKGDASKHWNSKDVPPACPTKCTQKYGRSLQTDLFKISTLRTVDKAYDFATAKGWMKDRGPISIAYSVYTDFSAYKSGVYKATSTKKTGGHAVKCVGYGSTFILCLNSWGTGWGDKGTFKMHASPKWDNGAKNIWWYTGPGSVPTYSMTGLPNPLLPALDTSMKPKR